MSSKKGRRQPFGGNETTSQTEAPEKSHVPQSSWISYRNFLRLIFIVIVFGGTAIAMQLRMRSTVERFECKVIKKYDHDPTAFTQGLLIDDEGKYLYESTGLVGASSIRKVELETGNIMQNFALPSDYFGEGLAKHGDRFYQLTWQNGKILIYDEDLNYMESRDFDGEMWGLTSDGKHLILSDGTYRLRFLDPETLTVVRSIEVRSDNSRVDDLNELEFVGGKIYANRYESDLLYIIHPSTGKVEAEIDTSGMWPRSQRPKGGVMNGIAFNSKLGQQGERGRILLTGKYCPHIYEVEFVLPE
ncbi:MAG: glutaminyl-peptide cyclotransferase [Pirellulaceae bacterium]